MTAAIQESKAMGVTLTRLILLLSYLSAAGATYADKLAIPGIVGEDDRVILDSWDHPWSAIGRLNFTTGGFCTATVVGPRRVLTAAHCLWNRRTARWYPPCALHFLAGYRRGDYKVHALVSHIQIAPGYQGKAPRPELDWAILTLDRDVSDSTGVIPFAERAVKGGDRLLQAGYSRDRRHLLTTDRSCQVKTIDTAGKLLLHDCDATFGDSGSPLLVTDENGIYRTAAVHIAMRVRKGKTLGVGVSSAAARAWIETHPVSAPLGGVKACERSPDRSREVVASTLP